jgi:hypothetical protein
MAQPPAGSHLPEWEQVDIPLHMLSNGEAGGRPVRVIRRPMAHSGPGPDLTVTCRSA